MDKVWVAVKMFAFAWPFWRKEGLIEGLNLLVSWKLFAMPQQADIVEMNNYNYECSLGIEFKLIA